MNPKFVIGREDYVWHAGLSNKNQLKTSKVKTLNLQLLLVDIFSRLDICLQDKAYRN